MSISKKMIGLCGGAALGLVLAAPNAAWAQAAPNAIEEVVVTAEKRETKLQDTSIAITSFTEKAIERDHIEGLENVSLRTPGLVFAATDGFTQVTLRGVGLDITSLGGETAVATYQDGVYLAQSFQSAMPVFDLERVEVLRGPQGTLYGRNATGGAVNFVTRNPEFSASGNAAVSYANYDRLRVEVGGTGPVSEKLALRGSFTYDDRDKGYRRNVVTGGRERGEITTAGRASALLRATDDLSITLRGDIERQDTGDGVFENIGFAPNQLAVTPQNLGGFLSLPNPLLGGASFAQVFGLTFPVATAGVTVSNPDDLRISTNGGNITVLRSRGVSGTVEWTPGNVTVKSITAFRHVDWRKVADQDGTNLDIFNVDGSQDGDTFTQELNVSGTAFADRLEWFAGGYYFDEDARATFLFDLPALQTTFEALIGLLGPGMSPLPPGSLAGAGASPLGRRLGSRQDQVVAFPFLDADLDQKSKSSAVFGETKYHLTEKFSLTTGLRYTKDEKKVVRSTTSNVLDPANLCLRAPESQSWSDVTGALTGEYKPQEDTLVYGKVSKGYKSGGFNLSECGGSFAPEKIWAYETGVKWTGLDRQLQLNLAAFYYDYSDIQIIRFINNASRVENAATADILGAEAEFVAAPQAIPGLTLSGNLGYLDAKYGHATFQDPIAGGEPIDVKGNRLIRAPKWKGTLAAEYRFPETHLGQFAVSGDVNFTGRYYFDVFNATLPNQAALLQKSYTVTNLRASWMPGGSGGHTEVQLFANNLTDEIFAETRLANGTLGAVVGHFSAPRTYGVRLSAKF